MKTLVIILCETRASSLTGELFMKNVKEPLNADIALCVRHNETDKDNIFYKNAKYVFECKEPESWADAFDKISEAEQSTENWRNLLQQLNEKGYKIFIGGGNNHTMPGQEGSGAIIAYYRWFLRNKLIETQIHTQYDYVIVTRSDFMWFIPHCPVKFLSKDYIYIPDGEQYGGYTDRHIIASSDNILKVLDVMHLIIHKPTLLNSIIDDKVQSENKSWGLVNPELLIQVNLEYNQLGNLVKYIPYAMFSVRERNGSSSFIPSLGTWNNQLGCNIKYQEEFNKYNYYKNIIKTGDDWLQFL